MIAHEKERNSWPLPGDTLNNQTLEEQELKNCKLCRYSKVCNSLPGICILLQYAAVGALILFLAYLLINQEFLY